MPYTARKYNDGLSEVIVEQMIQAGVEGISHPTDLEKALTENIHQRRSKRFPAPDPQ